MCGQLNQALCGVRLVKPLWGKSGTKQVKQRSTLRTHRESSWKKGNQKAKFGGQNTSPFLRLNKALGIAFLFITGSPQLLLLLHTRDKIIPNLVESLEGVSYIYMLFLKKLSWKINPWDTCTLQFWHQTRAYYFNLLWDKIYWSNKIYWKKILFVKWLKIWSYSMRVAPSWLHLSFLA